MIVLGIDTGGTFTDFVLARDNRLTIHKVLSTPAAPETAILQGIEELGLHRLQSLRRRLPSPVTRRGKAAKAGR